MSNNLFIEKVKLEPIKHKYFDDSGNEYLSVSKFLKFLSLPFEHSYAYRMADQETRDAWAAKGKFAADNGTRVHNALELYSQQKIVKPENKEIEEQVKEIIGLYSDYYKCHEEVCLYNDEYKLAGTTDKICVIGRKSNCEVDLADYKTNATDGKGIEYFSRFGNKMYPPIAHLDDCNYVKYSIQLSIYAYFFEQLTGRTVRRLYIHHCPFNDLKQHNIIPVMYMKNDVIAILEANKEKVLAELDLGKSYQEELIF